MCLFLIQLDAFSFYNRYQWFFFNLVEKNMFHYQFVFKQSYTGFTIH